MRLPPPPWCWDYSLCHHTLCSPGWPQIHHVAEDDHELPILLPLPPKRWAHGCSLTHPAQTDISSYRSREARTARRAGVHTWYLLVELKGISATFLFRSRISFTDPEDSSMHLSRADSEASPATSLCGRQKAWSVRCGERGGKEEGGGPVGSGWAGSCTHLEHRDVVLPALEDSPVAESGDVGQGHPGV